MYVHCIYIYIDYVDTDIYYIVYVDIDGIGIN